MINARDYKDRSEDIPKEKWKYKLCPYSTMTCIKPYSYCVEDCNLEVHL